MKGSNMHIGNHRFILFHTATKNIFLISHEKNICNCLSFMLTAQNALSLPPIESTAEHLTEGDEGSKNRDRKE